MKVLGTKGGVALWTLALASFVARAKAVQAEHVIALGQHCILAGHLATLAHQLFLGGMEQVAELRRWCC